MSSRTTSQGWVLGRIGSAPVVVAPTSLLLGLLIAGSWYPLVSSTLVGSGMMTVLGVVVATVAGVALSVTLHELAHGMVGTALGRRPVLYELHLWGGRTTFGPAHRWAPWKDVLTSLSGPAANAALALALRWTMSSGTISSAPVFVAVWALAWVNLALAVFNALPGLPLDGGHALAALIHQLTGRQRLGQQVAGVGGLAVLALIAWRWVLSPLLLQGSRPSSFALILAIMVSWPIATTSWRVLGLGRGQRAAARLDLASLVRPVAVTGADRSVEDIRLLLAGPTELVVLTEESRVLGTIDAAALEALDLPAGSRATAGQVCTALPAAAVTTRVTGPEAAAALRRAREVSRWLLVVDSGRVIGAVPTGAR